MSDILECTNLNKSFGSVSALKDVNLSLPAGRIIGLLGPNGSGKTTFLKIANGLLQPTSGEIRINGNLPGIDTKRIVSYLPDNTYLNDWMKVRDIIAFFQDFYEDFDKNKATEMLHHLNLSDNSRLKTLSKGNKEKVQLILVMARNAKLYLLDEPIGGVDPAARDYIMQTILTNYNDNASILLSTHLIGDVEKIFDHVVFLDRGQIVKNGAVDDIREESGKSIDSLFREVFKC